MSYQTQLIINAFQNRKSTRLPVMTGEDFVLMMGSLESRQKRQNS